MKKTPKHQIAENYATALYEAAVVDNSLEKVFNDCKCIDGVFSDAKELYILNNPELKKTQKQEIIQQIAKKLKISETFKNFLDILVENNRFTELKNVLSSFNRLYYKNQGIVAVMVQSAQPLNGKQQEKLEMGLQKVLKQKTMISYTINEDILGGIVVEFGTNRIDESIKGKLNRLEQVMKGNV